MPADGYRCPSCTTQYLHGGYCQACRRERRSYVKLRPADATAIVRLGDVPLRPLPRVAFPGWPSITAALNGGLPQGKLLMLAGVPGAGKSTLALGLVSDLEGVLYLSSEQEASDLREIGARCNYNCDEVAFSAQSGIRGVEEAIEDAKPSFVVIDSVQRIAAETGMVDTVTRLIALAQAYAAPMLLTCQVIKDDSWAGPRAVEHLVDGMAELASVEASLTDSRESGQSATIEQSAGGRSDSPVSKERAASTLTFTVVGKYRAGPVGRVARLRRLESGRIEEVAP